MQLERYKICDKISTQIEKNNNFEVPDMNDNRQNPIYLALKANKEARDECVRK
jgi:hypothetical protein